MTFCDLTIYNDNPLLIRLRTELDLLPNYEWFPYNFCDGCGMPTGDAYSSGHLVPSLWDLYLFFLLRPILFSELVIFPDCALRISLGTFSILHNEAKKNAKTNCCQKALCESIIKLNSKQVKFGCSQNHMIKSKATADPVYMCPQGPFPPAVAPTKKTNAFS